MDSQMLRRILGPLSGLIAVKKWDVFLSRVFSASGEKLQETSRGSVPFPIVSDSQIRRRRSLSEKSSWIQPFSNHSAYWSAFHDDHSGIRSAMNDARRSASPSNYRREIETRRSRTETAESPDKGNALKKTMTLRLK